MKRLTAIVIVLSILSSCVVFADTRSVTVGAEVYGVYQGTNHWSDATFTFDVTDGMAASFGWLSNGEYSFKYYPASGEIKGGGNKEKVFSASFVPQIIVVPNKIGALTTSYFTYDAKDIVTYGANDDQGVFVANNIANTTIVIPEGVTAIPQYSFAHNNSDNRNMRFILPSTLKTIGNRAFSGYSSGGLYVSFELPEGLETIGNGAFSQCRYENITIPSTVTVIQDSTFTYNTRLKTVVFNGDVTSIGSKSFEYCKELKSMRFKGLNAPALKSDTFNNFIDGYEFYVYYPYNGVGYDNKEWRESFPPNTHFIKIDADGNALPEEEEDDPYKAEYEKMRLKWREILLAETADPTDPDIAEKISAINSEAQSYWDSMLKNEERTKIWSNLGLTSERSLQETYERLLVMATAYATKGCQLYHNAQMLADIISAMDYIYDNGYYSSTGGGSGNWWQWQIGIPQKIIRICIILYDELSTEQKANYMSATRHFQNDITMTGANRMWECEVFIGRGIVENNAANIKVANEGISAVLGMVGGSGDGFYTDGSFIQHSIYPYNGGYGQSLFANIAEMIYILDDSPWEVTEAASSNLYDWLYKAYAPFIYKGQFMDMVRGREMARYYSDTYFIGTKIMSAMVNIADYAPEKFSNEIKSMIKYWYSQNNQVDFYANMESSSIVKTKKLLNDESINPMEEPVFYKQFYNMDRAVQARPGYAVGISMYSNRIGAFESINSENQRAYHTADGMIYLYNDDLLHYHDGFWPTVNLYRLSGTTVEKNTTIASNTKGTDPWAGGVELNGKYGITSMQLKSIGQNLSAKKSYFMFDDEIVCLGSDINSSDSVQVETIVENRKLSSPSDVFIIDDALKTGAEEEFSNINWASIEGKSANIGYYFPSGANVKALKEQRTGGWSNVATATNNVKYTADYATMWIEHGTNPQKETYEYVILPDKDSTATKEYTSNPHIEVLANSDEIQAAREIRNNITGVNFWTDGVKSIGGITSDSHGCVLTQVEDGVLSVAVSDPARTNLGWMNIELDMQANRIITTDDNVVVTQVSPTIKMSINMKSLKGATAKAYFDLTGSADHDLGKDIYIIDNDDAGFTTSGSWKTLSSGSMYYGKNYLADVTTTADMDSWAQWTPNIILPDEYDVYIRWVASSSQPQSASVEIAYADGVDKSKYINQRYNGGIWTYLGTYKMNSGTDGYVKLLADGVGQTSADAVKFVARNAQGESPFVYINMENTAQLVNADIIDGYITAVNIQNAQSAGSSADLIVALYKDNMLESIKIFSGIQTAEKITLTEPVKYIDGCTIKTLLWNIKNLQPLAVN